MARDARAGRSSSPGSDQGNQSFSSASAVETGLDADDIGALRRERVVR